MGIYPENNPEQERASLFGAHLRDLASVFGPALVPLRGDLGRFAIALGLEALPFGLNVAAQHETVAESEPAGVICGGGSGLLAMAFPRTETADEFLSHNPALACVLITRVQEALVIWLRPTNRLPPYTVQDGIKIITEGIIPVAHPELQLHCSIYRRGSPSVVDLSTLSFRGRMKEFFIDWTVRELHGPPVVQVSPRRRESLNPQYWGVWISKTVGIQFDTSRGLFVAKAPETNAEVIVEAGKLPGVIATMLHHARQAGVNLPVHKLNPGCTREIIAAMKMFCSISTPTETEILSEFIAAKLQRHPGSILAKNTVTDALLTFRRIRGLQPPANENGLRRDLRLAIRQLFGVRERHDAGRFFSGLALISNGKERTINAPRPHNKGEAAS